MTTFNHLNHKLFILNAINCIIIIYLKKMYYVLITLLYFDRYWVMAKHGVIVKVQSVT
jgi:hypothetical protein